MNIPHVVAHRGYALRYPENTLLAMEAAVAAGACYLECDIQLSADGVPLLCHDAELQRLCGRPGRVFDYRWEQLRGFSVTERLRFGERFSGTPLTTLEEFVEFLGRNPGVTAFVELKRESMERFGREAVVTAVLACLSRQAPAAEAEPPAGQAVVISYDAEALARVKARHGPALGLVTDAWDEATDARLADLRPAYLFCNRNGLPAVGELRREGLHVAVFEVYDPDEALALGARGVDLVETFAVGEMLSALNAFG